MARRAKTVAVMQPYFFPYSGYFRLMAVADHFVVFDCVQFPRRGWVHRCRVPSPAGGEEWLTLPLEPCPRDTRIMDLRFAADAGAALAARSKRYPCASGKGAAADALRRHLASPLDDVTSFLLDGLKLVSAALRVAPEITRSSALGLAPELRGQERVIAAARAVGGTRYVNAPGGRQLYDSRVFAEHGMEPNLKLPNGVTAIEGCGRRLCEAWAKCQSQKEEDASDLVFAEIDGHREADEERSNRDGDIETGVRRPAIERLVVDTPSRTRAGSRRARD